MMPLADGRWRGVADWLAENALMGSAFITAHLLLREVIRAA